MQNSAYIMNMISQDENILWHGKPNKQCYILEAIFNPFFFFALFWAYIDMHMIRVIVELWQYEMLLFFLIHMTPVWIYLGSVIYAALKYKNTEFIVTNKKIYVTGGVLKQSCKKKLYRQINEISPHQGYFDKKLNVGDVEMIDRSDYYHTKNGIRYNKFIIADIAEFRQVYELISKVKNTPEEERAYILTENSGFNYQGNYEQNNDYYPNYGNDDYNNPDRRIDI